MECVDSEQLQGFGYSLVEGLVLTVPRTSDKAPRGHALIDQTLETMQQFRRSDPEFRSLTTELAVAAISMEKLSTVNNDRRDQTDRQEALNRAGRLMIVITRNLIAPWNSRTPNLKSFAREDAQRHLEVLSQSGSEAVKTVAQGMHEALKSKNLL